MGKVICAAYIVILSVRNAGIVFIQEVNIIGGAIWRRQNIENVCFLDYQHKIVVVMF